MTTTKKTADNPRLMETIEQAEQTSLEAVRKFLDTVNDVFPDFGEGEDGPRRRIIDSAFRMTENLVGASTHLAQNIIDLTEQRLDEAEEKASAR